MFSRKRRPGAHLSFTEMLAVTHMDPEELEPKDRTLEEAQDHCFTCSFCEEWAGAWAEGEWEIMLSAAPSEGDRFVGGEEIPPGTFHCLV